MVQPLGRWHVWVALLYLLAFLVMAMDYAWDFHNGGHIWKQADWLINNHTVTIRRGLLGSVLLQAADGLRISPVALVIGIQISITFLILGTFVKVADAAAHHSGLLMLLGMPTFLLFGLYVPEAAGRKELLAYLSLLPYVWIWLWPVCAAHRTWLLGLAVCLFAVAAWSHEGLVFFAPIHLALIHSTLKTESGKQWPFHAAIVCIAVIAMLYAILHPSVPDVRAVCEPLLKRGVPESMCQGGAIEALTWQASHEVKSILQGLLWRLDFALTLMLMVGALMALASTLVGWRQAAWWACVVGLCFAPLYLIAVDWGRWLACQTYAYVCLVVVNAAPNAHLLKAWRMPKMVLTLSLCTLACVAVKNDGRLIWDMHVPQALARGAAYFNAMR